MYYICLKSKIFMKRTILFVLALSFSLGFAQESQELIKLKNQTDAKVTISRSTSNPNFIRFENPDGLQLKSAQANDKASEFLAENYKAFNLRAPQEMVFVEENTDNYGLKNVIYRQTYQGIPVYDGILKFHFNGKGQLSSLNGNTISNIKVSAIPTISQAEAASIAKNLVSQQNLNVSKKPLEIGKNNLLIFPKNLVQGGQVVSYLAYEIEVTNKSEVREFLFIDAHTGELVEQFTGIHPIDRKLYETSTASSNLKWKEGDAFPGTLDQWQQSEIVTAEHVYNFFKNAFNFVSYSNTNSSMITVNNDPNISCPNANWNGSTANYCTGVAADDVVAHEWGHAYTEYTSGLIYQYQAGALNESYSDVWGETIDLFNGYFDDGENVSVRTTTSCTGSVRWKMGEKASAFGGAIRDLWNPNCNGDPGRVLDTGNYYCGTGDSGGVHTNSGVTNHLYALLVDGGTYNGYTITGVGFVKAAHLWWRSQKNYLTPTSDFSTFADALEASAADLFGVNLQGLSTTTTPAGASGQSWAPSDMQNLQNAILAVQLRSSPNTQCNYQPILKPGIVLCASASTGALFTETWENGIGNWIITNIPTNPASWENRNWVLNTTLPKGRAGKGMFGADPVNGNCSTSLQNGILRLESPLITFPTFTGIYEMAFNHYVATEASWDGGNIKYSLNNGAWTLLPKTAFSQNAYNRNLDGTTSSDNPLKGQAAFSGTDGGSLTGSWGQSIVDLSKIGVVSGSTLKLRFEMGTDGCNGNDGWYLDEIYVYNCTDPILAVDNSTLQNGVQIYPNPTSGILTIQNDNKLKLQNVQVYSVTGQLIKTFKLDQNAKNSTIDISSFAKGTYIVKVNSDKESTNVKVIKK